MSKGGGSSSPSGTTTTTVTPWTAQQPYLEKGFQEAQSLLSGTAPQYYPYYTYATENPREMQGLTDIANTGSKDILPTNATTTLNDIMSGNYFGTNPAYDTLYSLAGDSSKPATALSSYLSGERIGKDNPYDKELASSVRADVVPQIESSFISGGMLSSPEAARATSEGVAAGIAPYTYKNYQNEEANQLAASGLLGNFQLGASKGLSDAYSDSMSQLIKAAGLAPAVDQSQYLPGTMEYTAGSKQGVYDQQLIDDAIARWNYDQTLPYTQLNQFIGQIGGNYGSTTTQPYYTNKSANLLGGALGGASLGSALFPAAEGATSYGALGGAGLGALLAFL